MGEEVRRLLSGGGGGEERWDEWDVCGRRLCRRMVVVGLGGGSDGASIGLWRAPEQALWVAVGFGLRLILSGARLARASGSSLLLVWTVIFLTVTLQMSTSLRPILGTSERLLPGERRFFLEHWARSLGGRGN